MFHRVLRELRRKAGVVYWHYILNGIVAPLVRRSYFRWAKFVLERKRPLIIGITGSVGKSTTTEVLSTILKHPTAEAVIGMIGGSIGNMNDHDNLPLVALGFRRPYDTLLQKVWVMCRLPFRAFRLAWFSRYPRVLVLEYGTDRAGYLQPLVDLAPPQIAIITTIGPAHLDGMGSMEGVVREKATLLRGDPPPRLVVLGEEHDYVSQLQSYTSAPVVRVGGRGPELAVNITRVVCEHLGVPDQAMDAMSGFKSLDGRLQPLHANGIDIIDDAYNASPLSMKLGLDTLARMEANGGRRVAVLGTMAELGEQSPALHADIGEYARRSADMIIGVGKMANHYNADLVYPDSAACAAVINDLVHKGDCVLVKGSASAKMSRIVECLRSGRTEHGRGTDRDRSVTGGHAP